MKAKSQDWEDTITAGHMDQVNVAIALTTTIWRTLSYPLLATVFTKEECEEIMRPAIRAALPKMGLNRNFPRDVVFGAKEYQGLGVQHLLTLQSIEPLKNVIAPNYIQI